VVQVVQQGEDSDQGMGQLKCHPVLGTRQ